MFDELELQQQVEKILAHSQSYDIDYLDCSKIISAWAMSKERLYKQFGEKLIVFKDHEVIVNLTPQEKQSCFENLIKTLEYDMGGRIPKKFIYYLKDNYLGFFDNIVVEAAEGIPEIKTGMKLLKSFKYFLEDSLLHTVQDLASTYIQKNKISGYMYASIHPISYLTISENNCGWRSCHALDGEYRAGNINYMLDDVTVVMGLVSSKEKEKLRCCPDDVKWLNNKWRMLVHIHPQNRIVYYNKPYPYFSAELQDEACFLLQDIFPRAGFSYPEPVGFMRLQLADSTFTNLERTHFWINYNMIDGAEIIKTNEHPTFFNDLLYSSTYAPWVSYSRDLHALGFFYPTQFSDWHKDLIGIKIGADAYCACCGKILDGETDDFLCHSCDRKAKIENY